MLKSKTALVVILTVIMLAPVGAQQLTINGSTTHANLPLDGALTHTLTLTGPGNTPFHWIADQDPGPTVTGGVSIPVGITPATIDIGLGLPFAPSGSAAVAFTVADLSLVGVTYYSAGVFLTPTGTVVSNGVSMTFVLPGADAGPDAATFVNQGVALDGSGILNGAGQVPAGANPLWIVTGAPAGSNPQLQDAQSAYPTFSADAPGAYTVELQVSLPGGLSADQVQVDVFDVQLSGTSDGAFVTGPVSLNGTADGPGIASLEINGAPVSLAGNAFSGGTLTPADVMNPITATVTTAAGQVIERTITVINGSSAPIGSIGSPGAATRLAGVSLDLLEPPVELALGALPLNQVFTAIPTIPLIPSGLLTANLTFTGASFDPATVDFDLFPTSCAIGMATTLNSLSITADITGTQLFGGPYSETATITADSVIISGEMVVGSNAQGGVEVTIQNTDATFVNFNASMTGVLGLFVGLLEPLIEGALEAALESSLNLIPTTLNPLLSGLVISVDLSTTGVPLQVDLPINSVCYDAAGLTLVNDFRATPTQTSPSAPALTGYLTTTGGVPIFGPVTPVNGAAYDFALGIDDELLNQTFAALTTAGALDLDLGAVGGTAMTAGMAATMLPGAGFDRFDPGTPVTVEVRQTTAPAVTFSATGDAASLSLGNLRLVFTAAPNPGDRVPVLETGVTAHSALTVTIDPTTGTLSITPGATTVTSTAGGAMAGGDAVAALVGIDGIVQQILPLLTQPLNAIPLPFTNVGGGVVEISVPSSGPSMLVTWLDAP